VIRHITHNARMSFNKPLELMNQPRNVGCNSYRMIIRLPNQPRFYLGCH